MRQAHPANQKNGIFCIGHVDNIPSYADELRALTHDGNITEKDINDAVDNAAKEFYNKAGYMQFPDGLPVTEQLAKYIRFQLPMQTPQGEDIYGWFYRERPQSYLKGVKWGTHNDFIRFVQSNNMFRIGQIAFESKDEGEAFLNDIAQSTIPESWSYGNSTSQATHPILRSYIENILKRLIKESEDGIANKLVFSNNNNYVKFNLNLLDKYFHDVIIVGSVDRVSNEIIIRNPYRLQSEVESRKLGFPKGAVLPPHFFDDVNDVIFQTSWTIDEDYDAFTHIIEERINRFPPEYQNEAPEQLARKLDEAIKYAVALSQRNYKFIVPMYRPQKDSIQLLMPIYLKGTYSSNPDFALVLTPDKINQLYIPETILPLDAAYQNARLIAKPDEAWLNPNTL